MDTLGTGHGYLGIHEAHVGTTTLHHFLLLNMVLRLLT